MTAERLPFASEGTETSLVCASPSSALDSRLRQLLEEWRQRYILRGEFLGNDELQILLDELFPGGSAWPEVLVLLFFVDERPLLSLSRAFSAGRAVPFNKRRFYDTKQTVEDFSRQGIPVDKMRSYIDAPLRTDLSELRCVHLQNESSPARPIVKLIGPDLVVSELTDSEVIKDALTLICTFSVQLFSKRATERGKQVAEGVRRSLCYRSTRSSSVEQLLDRLLQTAAQLTRSEAGSVYFENESTQVLNLVSHYGELTPPDTFENTAPNVIPYVFRNQGLRFFLANDVRATLQYYEDDITYCPAFSTPDDRPVNELVFPIQAFEPVKPRTIGILNLERRGDPFRKNEIVLLENLLNHFSFELHGVRLYEPLHDTIQWYLGEVVAASWQSGTVAETLRQLGPRLLRPLLAQTPCNSISVRVYDGITTSLRRVFLGARRERDRYTQADTEIGVPAKLGRSSVAYAFAHNRTVYIPSFDPSEIRSVTQEYPGLENIIRVEGRPSRCSLTVPLRVGLRPVGTVNFESADEHVLLSYQPILENHVGLVSFLLLFAELMRVKSVFGQELELLASLHTIRSCLKNLQKGVATEMHSPDAAAELQQTLTRALDQLSFHQRALQADGPSSIGLDDLLRGLVVSISGSEWERSFNISCPAARISVRASDRPRLTYALDNLLRNAKGASPIGWPVRVKVNTLWPRIARVTIQNCSTSEMPDDEFEQYLWGPIQREAKTCLGGFLARQHLLSIGGDLFFSKVEMYPYPGFTAVAEVPTGDA